MPRKICVYCGKRKNPKSFYKHRGHKDILDSRCKKCMKENLNLRHKLKKTAPPKPELCECCKKVPPKWCLDHEYETEQFRGWLCENCNLGLGLLGDNLQGITNAMNYLLSKRRSYDQS